MKFYLLYSVDKDLFWRPNRDGYTSDVTWAGLYEESAAKEIAARNSSVVLHDAMLALRSAMEEAHAKQQRAFDLLMECVRGEST